jgi:hypothetical protein
MAGVPVPSYQQFWADKQSNLKKEYQTTAKTHPDAVPCMQHLFKVLCDLEALAGCTPRSVGESQEWDAFISAAEDNQESYSVALQGKTLHSAQYGTYTVTLNDLKSLLKSNSQPSQGDGFQEVRSRKRHFTAEAARSPKKTAVPTPTGQVLTKNFYSPLRATNMETEATVTEPIPPEATAQGKTGRQPPIVLTSAVNLIELQKQLKGVAKENF